MRERLWLQFMTNNGHYSPEDPSYRRASLLNLVLLVTAGTFFLFVLSGVFVTKRYVLSAVLAVAFLVVLGIRHYFKRTNSLEASATVTVLVLLVTLLAYVIMSENQRYALYWCATVPPITYSLLGFKKANLANVAFYGVVLVFIFATYQSWPPADFGSGSIVNLGAATAALVLITSYMEGSRRKAQAVLEDANRELERLSVTDKLTGLFNRTKLDAILDYETARALRGGAGFALLIADVDRLKAVNDAHGHLAGDEVLIRVATLLASSCREVDFVGRWGGDEFLVLCPAADEAGIAAIAERIIESMGTRAFGEAGSVSLSIGTAVYRHGDSADAILRRADTALYAAKAAGRGRVRSA